MFGGSKVNKFMELLGEKLMPLAAKLGENRYLTTLRDAFMLAFPLTMFGSIAVVLMNLPFWSDETKAVLQLYLGNAQSATMSIMTVFVVDIHYLNIIKLKQFMEGQLPLLAS